MHDWILFTLLAATMQAVRTAGQKALSQQVSAITTTFVRYGFGAPFILLYLLALIIVKPEWRTEIANIDFSDHGRFVHFSTVGAIAQILATFALIKVFSQRNFAVATSFAKTEAIQVALFGVILFSETLSIFAWAGVVIGAFGTVAISGVVISRKKLRGQLLTPASLWGILSGCLFAVTSLFLRQASLSLELPYVLSASITLTYMVVLQTAICALIILYKQKDQLRLLKKLYKTCFFIGFTSAAGSIGWFTAMSAHNAAAVKTLGQMEFFITLAITAFYFKERIMKVEWLGMSLVLVSVLLVVVK